MRTRPRSLTVVAIIAITFGLLTIVSGARALFGGADMGAVVPFVLWFNFLAGLLTSPLALASGVKRAGQQASRSLSPLPLPLSSRRFYGGFHPVQLLRPAPWEPWRCDWLSG